ncbi:hypothetical protein Trydic_g16079 [Trypoxylus dichotomus]
MGKPSKYFDTLTKSLGKATITIQLAVNAGILVVTVIGWVGIFQKRRTCLLLYGIVVLISGILLLIVGILALAMIGAIEAGRSRMINALNEHYGNYTTDDKAKMMMDNMHAYYECCGAEKPIKINNEYPLSCCKTLDDGKCLKPYEKTCVDILLHESVRSSVEIGIIMIIFGLFLQCAGIAAMIYRRMIHTPLD